MTNRRRFMAAVCAAASCVYANTSGGSANCQTLSPVAAPMLSNLAALKSATIPSGVSVVQTAGYYTAGDLGVARYVRIATPGSPQPWQVQSADGSWWQLATNPITPFQLGAKADNRNDDATAEQNAINYAQTFNAQLYHPFGRYTFGSQIVQTSPITVRSDKSGSMRWTNSGSSGWLADLRSAASNPGLTSIELPGLFSSAIDSTFAYPGYPNSWTGGARVGTGFKLEGGSRINVDILYEVGWASCFDLVATYDVTNGGRAPQNINATINTMDLCVKGIELDAGPANAGTMAGIAVTANTVFAKFPIYLDDATNSIAQANVTISGQAFTNEAGGAGIYDTGTMTSDSTFDIRWLYAGHGNDSPAGTASTLTLPWIAGAAASHGQTIDGNATVGYFGGSHNDFSIGQATILAAQPGGEYPVSGAVTRIRDAGAFNRMNVRFDQTNPTAAIVLSTTQGEANFGAGGVGGAGIGTAGVSRRILVSAAVPTLTSGARALFWFYHTWLSAGAIHPIMIEDAAGTIATSALSVVTGDNSTKNNREAYVAFKNTTSSSIPGATYTFWVEIMD